MQIFDLKFELFLQSNGVENNAQNENISCQTCVKTYYRKNRSLVVIDLFNS